MPRSARPADCHPDKTHYALGLCEKCYRTDARVAAGSNAADCHPKQPHFSNGLCSRCYMRRWRSDPKNRAKKNAGTRRWYEAIKTTAGFIKKKRLAHLRNAYGLDLDAFEAMLKSQKNACAICRRVFSARLRPCVDHNHRSKKVRGLLCSTCNLGIAALKEDAAILRGAIKYLAKWEKAK